MITVKLLLAEGIDASGHTTGADLFWHAKLEQHSMRTPKEVIAPFGHHYDVNFEDAERLRNSSTNKAIRGMPFGFVIHHTTPSHRLALAGSTMIHLNNTDMHSGHSAIAGIRDSLRWGPIDHELIHQIRHNAGFDTDEVEALRKEGYNAYSPERTEEDLHHILLPKGYFFARHFHGQTLKHNVGMLHGKHTPIRLVKRAVSQGRRYFHGINHITWNPLQTHIYDPNSQITFDSKPINDHFYTLPEDQMKAYGWRYGSAIKPKKKK